MIQLDHGFEGLSRNLIQGVGPVPCPVMLVGESPGVEEDKCGVPFVGRTGQELDGFYLKSALLKRHEVYITNLVKCHPLVNRDPTKDEIKYFEPLMLEEIERVQPSLIVPMGLFATRWFLGGHADLHTMHGLPHEREKFKGITILPSYHPAAGLHNAENQPLIIYDFDRIRQFLEGTLQPRPRDPFKTSTRYIELTQPVDTVNALTRALRLGAPVIAIDTEGYRGHNWGLSFSYEEGTAFVIRAMWKRALRIFAAWLKEHPEIVVLLHNSLHDLPILREMGIHVPNFVDTMIYPFGLVLEPQGLKDLAYRHAGMTMKSYEDVTGPAMRRVALEHLVAVASRDWGMESPVPVMSGEEVIYKQPQALHKRALKAVNDSLGMWTGTVVGPRRGGSKRLKEMGVRVGKVDKEFVEREEVPKEMNAWHVQVPIPVKPLLDQDYGNYIYELKPPVAPSEPADALKRWEAIAESLPESVERAEEVVGSLPEVGLDALDDQRVAIDYSARDADATLRVYGPLIKSVEAANLERLVDLDQAIMPYVDRMKTTGIKANTEHLITYGKQLALEMRDTQAQIKEMTGEWINPSSSQQTATLVYDILKLPCETFTETGLPSTADKILEGMSELHPVIKLITDYRELNKLRGTYALKLPKWCDENSRIHPNWKATRVPSGRFACSNPNLMAIPVRSERANMIRKGFVPREGCVLIGVDLGQIEMRVLAELSMDQNLIQAFLDGHDIHSATAAYMWKCTIEEIEAEHKGRPFNGQDPDMSKIGGASRRSSAKNVGFGIVYGISAMGLQAQMKSKTKIEYTVEECQDMIDLYLEKAYPQVNFYMERQKYFARRKGFVESPLGRRRYLPGINSTIHRLREEAGRMAVNHPVQAGAAEIIKMAMRDLWNDALPVFWKMGCYVEPILQIHDELVFEVDISVAEEWMAVVVSAMEKATRLVVPITADGHMSEVSWADLKG